MVLKSIISNLSIVNLLSDFILNKIPKEEESIIQVIDFNNFYVIKGKTTYNVPLDIVKIKNEFIEINGSLLKNTNLSHTIDLIEYTAKLDKLDSLSVIFHNNTDNCSYHPKQCESYEIDPTNSYDYNFMIKTISDDNALSFCSEFPHGFSLHQGRLLYYYGKYIFYSIPSSYPVSSLIFNMSTNKINDGEQLFSVINGNTIDTILTSAILDVFDFDMTWLETEIKKADWSIEITSPLQDYSFLKKKNSNFIIF